MTFGLLLILSYSIGGIPVGVLVARTRGVDILKAGSGNIGATNVGRVLGKGPGLAVWGLDVLKSLAPTLAARALLPHGVGPLAPESAWFLVGAMAILGHCASPFLGFRGGKGISTALGAMVGTAPLVALPCFGLFAFVLATTRYMAIASTVGVLSVIVFGLLLGVTHQLTPVFLVLGLFVAYRHRSNFRRLREGTEPRFSFKKAGAPPDEGGRRRAVGFDDGLLPSTDQVGSSSGKGLRISGNPQLVNPYETDASHMVQIVDSILEQFLPSGQRAELISEEVSVKILFDGQPNGQLPHELFTNVLRRLELVSGMDPLKHLEHRTGTIRGTFDGEPFTLRAESFPVTEGVAFTLDRE